MWFAIAETTTAGKDTVLMVSEVALVLWTPNWETLTL
jgi:hypothetical protein